MWVFQSARRTSKCALCFGYRAIILVIGVKQLLGLYILICWSCSLCFRAAAPCGVSTSDLWEGGGGWAHRNVPRCAFREERRGCVELLLTDWWFTPLVPRGRQHIPSPPPPPATCVRSHTGSARSRVNTQQDAEIVRSAPTRPDALEHIYTAPCYTLDCFLVIGLIVCASVYWSVLLPPLWRLVPAKGGSGLAWHQSDYLVQL